MLGTIAADWRAATENWTRNSLLVPPGDRSTVPALRDEHVEHVGQKFRAEDVGSSSVGLGR